MTAALIVLAGGIGYLVGAVPTGVLVCRALGVPDVRRTGSGHTGGLNVSRSAGLGAGVLTASIDALKGVAAVTVALALTGEPWGAAASGITAVVGHNWSAWLRFEGGIGLSTLFGAQLAFSPIPAVMGLILLGSLWLILQAAMRVHRARATIGVMVITGPFLWAVWRVLSTAPSVPLGSSVLLWPGVLMGALGGLVVIAKTLPDWNRQYN